MHWLAILNTKTPVARSAPAMRYCDDTDDVLIAEKDQAVGETSERHAPMNGIELFA